MKIKKLIRPLLISVAILYIATLSMMYFTQHKSQYQPKIKTQHDFERIALAQGAEVATYKTHDGIELDSLYYPAEYDKPVFLYFNGNAGTIEQAYNKFKPFIDEGYGVFINVFRGFGPNPGVPSESNFFTDAETAYNLLLDFGYEEKEIIIYGYSLGTGVAVHLSSSKPNSRSLIVECGFTSATDVAYAWFPYLPVDVLLKDKYESEVYMQQNKLPKLIMHGDIDLKVPTRFGRRLYERSPEPKEFHLFKGGTHGNLQELGATDMIFKFIEN
jgi:uncharacterized protein